MASDPTFHPYPELPLDIKRIIWKQAVDDIKTRDLDILLIYTTPSHVSHHGLLHACQESRFAYLKVYEPWGEYTVSKSFWRPAKPYNGPLKMSYAYVAFGKDNFAINHIPTYPHMPYWFVGTFIGEVARSSSGDYFRSMDDERMKRVDGVKVYVRDQVHGWFDWDVTLHELEFGLGSYV